MTLRAYIQSLIQKLSASDIGERQWQAKRLERLLADYDRSRK